MSGAGSLTLAAAAIAAVMGTSYAAGVRWNTTPSMPMGLWLVRSVEGHVQRGETVTLCLGAAAAAFGRRRGYLSAGACPGDVELLIKTVAAIPSDWVDVSDKGIAVNGVLIPRTTPLPRDDRGRALGAMPPGRYRVGSGQVWVIGGADVRSFDSRYFGSVPMDGLRGQARPLFVSK